MLCPSFGRENPLEAGFCNSCGSRIDQRCPDRNRTNPPGSALCNACGQSLTEAASPSRTPTPQPSPASFAGGRYQLQRFLGEGGRKRVYLAHGSKLDRDELVNRLSLQWVIAAWRWRYSCLTARKKEALFGSGYDAAKKFFKQWKDWGIGMAFDFQEYNRSWSSGAAAGE